VPSAFRNLTFSSRRHDDLLAEMQRFRGRVYLSDGAIAASELTPDGRHKLAIDQHSWHLLTMDSSGQVCGCLRYLEEKRATRFDQLWIRQAALARCPIWGSKFRRAVETEMARARQKCLGFGEVGGWAVAESRRWTTDPLRMVLGACGLFRVLGGCIGLATATVRHGSSAILRRVGLNPLTTDGLAMPSYYDPHYGCQMEALRFDSDSPNPKYAKTIEELGVLLETVPVLCRESKPAQWNVWRGLELPPAKPAPLPALQPVA
jgi:hypothetical protein